MPTTRPRTTRLHDSYDGLALDDLVNLHDIGALAGVQRDTAYRWSTRPGFPQPAGDGTWKIGEVVDWLCSTGRLTGCDGDQDLLRRTQVAAITGLSLSTLKVYVWQGKFPKPSERVGRHPVWRRSAVEEWIGTRVDRRTRTGRQEAAS